VSNLKKLINRPNQIVKGVLAMTLAGTFAFSLPAFANESTEEQPVYETVDLEELQSQLENTQTEKPSVIPGDFFYFVKIAFEKIKLAITFDNAKEAELMAQYASERLAEAAALYDEGKKDEAVKVIETAIDFMEKTEAVIAGDLATDETKATEATATEEGPSDEIAARETQETDEQNPYAETEKMIRNNVLALSAAMNHVGNEKAQAALQKNIDKTFAKMAKKMAKLEKKYGKKVKENKEAEIEAPESAAGETEAADLEAVAVPNDNGFSSKENGEVTTSKENGNGEVTTTIPNAVTPQTPFKEANEKPSAEEKFKPGKNMEEHGKRKSAEDFNKKKENKGEKKHGNA
jgi:hypothetical protein